jgi:hypothetical protein
MSFLEPTALQEPAVLSICPSAAANVAVYSLGILKSI